MSDDEREELVHRLLEEFRQSVKHTMSNNERFAFIAGARSALHAVMTETDEVGR
jgi:hypothetical protein